MHLLNIACAAKAYHDAHPAENVFVRYLLGEHLLRWLQEDTEYLARYEAAADKVRAYGIYVQKIPTSSPRNVHALVWDAFEDCTDWSYQVDGFRFVPEYYGQYQPQHDAFRAAFQPCPDAPLDALVQTWLAIDAACDALGIKKILLMKPPQRFTGAHRARLLETAVTMTSTLVPRGWLYYPIPHDAPAAPDGLWFHFGADSYHGGWTLAFVEHVLAHAAQTTPWRLPACSEWPPK